MARKKTALTCLPKGSLSSICGPGPLSDTVTSRRLGSKGTSHLFSWPPSWLEDSRWTFMAWTVSSTHFKTWREEKKKKKNITRTVTELHVPPEATHASVDEADLERWQRAGRTPCWPFPESSNQPLPYPKAQAGLCLWTILSLQNYSSEGLCLNKGKVEQFDCQTDNTQFSALPSMYSQRSVSQSGSLSGRSPPPTAFMNHKTCSSE